MMKNKLLLLSCFALCFSIQAQDVNQDFRTNTISIFKNGTAFFIKSGTVKTADKKYRMTEHIPPALFGTYWINAGANELDYLSSYVDTLYRTEKIPANTIPTMLSANVGKKVKLHVGSEVLEGVLEAMEAAQNKLQVAPALQYIVQFRTSDKWLTLRSSDIHRIEFLEKPNPFYEQKGQEIKPVIQVNFNSNKPGQALDMMYLAKGLNWTPQYLIELTGEEKARLTLRAEVVNDIEDIRNSDVNFVVGVPNFSFADRLSPLVDFSASGFMQQLTGDLDRFSNVGQVYNPNTYEVEDFAPAPAPAAADGLDGSTEEDLFFYTLKNMSLKKGGRGHFPVFTADINIAHIYECNLPQNKSAKSFYRDDFLFSPEPFNVFHSIKVVNDTKYPFTSGPALVVKQQGDTKPISQDRLNYTSVNGHSFVKLTAAPDVRIKQAEKAIKTVAQAKTVNSGSYTYTYDLVTVEGQIKVMNYKDKKIDLNIRRTLIGDLQQSSVKWLKSARINTSGDPNALTDVCWETNVGAGKELIITYTYQIWVRS